MKKVICLYRVSTKKQTNKEDDIPVQREACLEYIEKHNQQFGDWEYYTEIVEGGVSAYHKKIEDREIQQVIDIVRNNQQDRFVLLAFYSDRISRQDANGFNFIDSLHKLQVEVYTVQEGKLSIDTEQDRLMLFIKFWGNNNESRKTANRVDAARKMLTELGTWTGGTVPYGYILQPTGEISKKGRVVNSLVRDPQESTIVKEIYDMLVNQNMTLNGIMNELNSRGLKTKKNCKWNTSTIKNILKNPVYKGYLSYKKTTQQGETRQRETDTSAWVLAKEKNLDYVIVEEAQWQLAQDILARKRKTYTDNLYMDGTYKNSRLLTGLLVCGYCGNTISPAVSQQWSGKKKQKKVYIEYYKCNLRAKGAKMCAGKTYISAKKLEGAVLEQVYLYLDSLNKIDCTSDIEHMVLQSSMEDKKLLNELKKEHTTIQSKIKALEEEIIKAVLGESALSKENINMVLDKQKESLQRIEAEISEVNSRIIAKEISEKEVLLVQRLIPVWREVFETASLNVKKVLLSLLIEKIVVMGQDVDIYFRITLEQFIKNMNKHTDGGRANKSSATIALKELDKDIKKYIVLCNDRTSYIANKVYTASGDGQYIVPYEDWSSHLPHQIVTEMLALEAIAAGDSKIIKVLIGIAFGNGREGFQSIFGRPDRFFCGFVGKLDFVSADHAAKDSAVGFQIIGIVFHVFGDFFHGGALLNSGGQLFQIRFPVSGEVAAVSGTQPCKKLYPVVMRLFPVAVHIKPQRLPHGFGSDVKIDPFNVLFGIGRTGQGCEIRGLMQGFPDKKAAENQGQKQSRSNSSAKQASAAGCFLTARYR